MQETQKERQIDKNMMQEKEDLVQERENATQEKEDKVQKRENAAQEKEDLVQKRENAARKKEDGVQDGSDTQAAVKYIWEKNWELPLFIIAAITFLVLLLCFSAKKGFYVPVFGNDTNDTLAIADENDCDGMFLRSGLNAIKTEFPKDTTDVDACNEKYNRYGNILWIDKRYLGIGFFSYLIVIDTKYHTETRDCLERVSIWKRVSMSNPRTEEELGETAVRLIGM